MLKKIIEALRHIFCLKCPDCGGIMVDIDLHYDHAVYKCEQCGKEWI